MDRQRFKHLHESGKTFADELGSLFIEIFHYLALFVIGASIVWSAVVAYGDILLLFIYLELGAMVGISQVQPDAGALPDLHCHHRLGQIADKRHTGPSSGGYGNLAGVGRDTVVGSGDADHP